ncbi:MAG: serine protein kinase RIO [Thermoplasmata archaeon]|nr:serine protein kinase RIO [Thermoplasmata archaeon]
MKKEIDKYLYEKIIPYRQERREKDMDDRKAYGGVFDKRTLLAFYKLLKKGVIQEVEFPISTGKEGDVFRARRDDELLAVKVYRMATINYKGLSRFIDGDDRFTHIHKTKDTIIFLWSRKEFRNLGDYYNRGVSVPRPVALWKNILVMEYIGDESRPAPLLKEVLNRVHREIGYEIIEEMRKMLKAKLVHGDLSEYNILIWEDKPYIIDVAQAVPINHPLANELFLRDVKNMVRVLNKIGLGITKKELIKEIEVI